MVRTSDLVFGCSVVRVYHPYIFRESSVTTFKLFKIQSQSLSIDVVWWVEYNADLPKDRKRQRLRYISQNDRLPLLSLLFSLEAKRSFHPVMSDVILDQRFLESTTPGR